MENRVFESIDKEIAKGENTFYFYGDYIHMIMQFLFLFILHYALYFSTFTPNCNCIFIHLKGYFYAKLIHFVQKRPLISSFILSHDHLEDRHDQNQYSKRNTVISKYLEIMLFNISHQKLDS